MGSCIISAQMNHCLWCRFAMIAVILIFKLTLWWLYMIFDDNYFRQICAPNFGTIKNEMRVPVHMG
jgi:hypothetical protein